MAIGYDLGAWLAGEKDLDAIQAALSREKVIRAVVAESGEDRQTVIDVLDARISMDQEAVLNLTDGGPTTLHDALRRYVDQVDRSTSAGEDIPADILVDLQALLAYPWPGARLDGHQSNDFYNWIGSDGKGGSFSAGGVTAEVYPDGGMVVRA